MIAALLIVSWVAPVWFEAKAAADYSAHAALTKEICIELAAIPPGEQYPESLRELKLSYPDGGDDSLLERFEFHSNGTSCTLKTELAWSENDREVIARSFPNYAADPKKGF
jgi:hypothetical protein